MKNKLVFILFLASVLGIFVINGVQAQETRLPLTQEAVQEIKMHEKKEQKSITI